MSHYNLNRKLKFWMRGTSEAWLPQNSKYPGPVGTNHKQITDKDHTLNLSFQDLSRSVEACNFHASSKAGQLHEGTLTFGEKKKALPQFVPFQSKEDSGHMDKFSIVQSQEKI